MERTAKASSAKRRWHFKSECADCAHRQFCLPATLDERSREAFETALEHPTLIAPGRHLYAPGDTPGAVYAVRVGAVKCYRLTEDGEEQITGFRVAGELVGLYHLGRDSRETGAITLDYTLVCKISFAKLASLLGRLPGLQHQVFRLLSQDVQSHADMMRILARRGADQRLAFALLDLAERVSRNGGRGDRFHLPMTRTDLAGYLGIAHETISRLFRRLEDNGLIRVSGRHVMLDDVQGLRLLAKGSEFGAPSGNRKAR